MRQCLGRTVGVLAVCATLSGCVGGGGGSGPVIVPSRGVVTYKGKPVPKLSVAFLPEKGMVAEGTTDANGRFTLTTKKLGDGAMVGPHKVGISVVPDSVPDMPGLPGTKKDEEESPIPRKYADANTSGLTVVVENTAAKNDFTFELTD
jgi:hypothetical protein